MELFPHPPYRLDLTAWALRRRARNRVDQWDGSYRRTLLVGERSVPIKIDQFGSADQPAIRVELHSPGGCDASELDGATRQVTGLLGLDVDLHGFYEVADRNSLTRPLKDRLLGPRLDVFPGDDVGARNKLQRFLGLDHAPGYEEIADRLAPWQPWAGMLYFHLLLDGLVERGDLVL